MLYNLHFFSSKCRLFHNATLFGFCITHILNTGCAKIKKKIRRQKVKVWPSPASLKLQYIFFTFITKKKAQYPKKTAKIIIIPL